MKITGILIFVLIVCGCSKKSGPPPVKALPPEAAQLSAPDNNQPCITGTSVSDTTNSVTFSWQNAANADEYEIDVTNLLNNATLTKNTTNNFIDIVLLKSTPYSWQVVSKSTEATQTAKSDTWKFYNSGPAQTTFAPFPAELTAPLLGQQFQGQTSITLKWVGSAIENNISGYDVYWGKSSSPPFYQSTSGESITVKVTGNTIYYWQVITKDKSGNSSSSQIYKFSNN